MAQTYAVPTIKTVNGSYTLLVDGARRNKVAVRYEAANPYTARLHLIVADWGDDAPSDDAEPEKELAQGDLETLKVDVGQYIYGRVVTDDGAPAHRSNTVNAWDVA